MTTPNPRLTPKTNLPASAPTGPAVPGLLGRVATRPDPKVPYTAILRRGENPGFRGVIGICIGLLAGYAGVVTLTVQLLVALGWVLRGRPQPMADYQRAALAYELPEGLVAGHLGLALLIPLTMLLVRYLHGTPPAWLVSVAPGMRWKYLFGCLGLAAVGLNAVIWLLRVGTPTSWSVPDNAWLWVLLILICSPLQAAGEEFFFRGYLMQALGATTRWTWFPIVGSALLFAVLHGTQNVWLFIDRFAFGLLAGLLVVLTGGLEAGIAAHVANNLFAFGYAVFSGGVASARGLQQVGPMQALSDVLAFAVVAGLTWLLSRRMKLARLTPPLPVQPSLRTKRRSKRKKR